MSLLHHNQEPINVIIANKIVLKYLPWFINSEGLLVPPEVLWVSRVWFEVLIDDILLWDGKALLSISPELGLQKSSVKLCFFTRWPWIFSPLDGSSTEIMSGGFVQHPRKPLLCYKLGSCHINDQCIGRIYRDITS